MFLLSLLFSSIRAKIFESKTKFDRDLQQILQNFIYSLLEISTEYEEVASLTFNFQANEWKQNLEKKSKMFAKPLVPLLWGPHFELPAKGVPEEVEEAVFFEYSDDSDDVEVDYDDDYSKHDSSGSCHDDIYIDD